MAQPSKVTATHQFAEANRYLSELTSGAHLVAAPLPLPAIALRVMRMTEEDSDAATLAGLIQKDAGLAAQIVKVANSALYARRSPVTSMQQAISWLGMSEVRKLAVSCALRAQLFAGTASEQALRPIWTESLASACFGQEIARLQRRSVEPAYLAGLLHRAGFAALLQALTKSASLAALLADADLLNEIAAAHESGFARLLVRDWNLPDSLAATLCWWRSPADEAARKLARGSRQNLLEVVIARSFAAQLTQPNVMDSDELPPEISESTHDSAGELGLYRDDLQGLWLKRGAVRECMGSLQ